MMIPDEVRGTLHMALRAARGEWNTMHMRGIIDQQELDERLSKFDAAHAALDALLHKTAMQQYLAGQPHIVATRDEWNQRYVDGWNDGNNDAKGSGEQVCAACDGDGEIEDHSHISPCVDGDWPMIRCGRCDGTGIEPQSDALPQPPQPDWNEAPEWAEWWAVDPERVWRGDHLVNATWHELEPELDGIRWWAQRNDDGDPLGKHEAAGVVKIPLGIDWRTLKRRRPQPEPNP